MLLAVHKSRDQDAIFERKLAESESWQELQSECRFLETGYQTCDAVQVRLTAIAR